MKKEQDTKLGAYSYRIAHCVKHICASAETMFLRIGSGELPEKWTWPENGPELSELWCNLLEEKEK